MVDTQDSLIIDIQQLISLALDIPIDEITPDLAFGDLPQWDSMGHMDIMLQLEEQYHVDVSADTIAALTDIPTICTYLKEHNHV
jgi:acyl carrier protein